MFLRLAVLMFFLSFQRIHLEVSFSKILLPSNGNANNITFEYAFVAALTQQLASQGHIPAYMGKIQKSKQQLICLFLFFFYKQAAIPAFNANSEFYHVIKIHASI